MKNETNGLLMKRTQIFCLVFVGVFFLAATAGAQGKSGKGRKSGATSSSPIESSKSAQREPMVEVKWGFSDDEREIMHSYVQSYGGKEGKREKRLPPGLAKKVARGGHLPPGWQKKCVAGEFMPPEVYDQCHPLPPELVVKLPPPPEPTLTVTIGGKIVRILKATREILDVFDVNVRF
ncbi:MAG TPA: hypothetical protein VJA21_33225 [Verrucomicrobiae bacterium]